MRSTTFGIYIYIVSTVQCNKSDNHNHHHIFPLYLLPRLYQVLTTVFGLQVKYNGQYNVDVALPKTYQGIMCGLCGDMDGDGSAGDEFVNADFDVVNFES